MADPRLIGIGLGQLWSEAETQLLGQLILEAYPYGLSGREPPLFWERIVQRLEKARVGPRNYLADDCSRHYHTEIELKIRVLGRTGEASGRPWSERESDILRTFIHHTLPGGLFKTGLMLWKEIGEKMTAAALQLWLPFRMYDDNCLREHYFRHIRPRFVGADGVRIPEDVIVAKAYSDPPWSDVEHDLLRLNIHFTLPGGLLNATIQLWPEISRNMMRDAPQVGIPYRLYTEDNVRAQYFNYIRPCYAPSSPYPSSNVHMGGREQPYSHRRLYEA